MKEDSTTRVGVDDNDQKCRERGSVVEPSAFEFNGESVKCKGTKRSVGREGREWREVNESATSEGQIDGEDSTVEAV